MLARSYKTAEDLNLSEIEVSALIDVLHRLERNELTAYDGVNVTKNTIYMRTFFHTEPSHECGTIGCLCGWANLITEGEAFRELNNIIDGTVSSGYNLVTRLPSEAKEMFMIEHEKWSSRDPSTEEITTKLRNYLTTGNISG